MSTFLPQPANEKDMQWGKAPPCDHVAWGSHCRNCVRQNVVVEKPAEGVGGIPLRAVNCLTKLI